MWFMRESVVFLKAVEIKWFHVTHVLANLMMDSYMTGQVCVCDCSRGVTVTNFVLVKMGKINLEFGRRGRASMHYLTNT